jgi:fatty-acyl-CoA synthase
MFHCNGWCYAWSIAAAAGTNICLRKCDPAEIFRQIREHRVTHYCGAPIVQNMMIGASPELKEGIEHRVQGMVAGAAPPASTLEAMEKMGIQLTHVYGLTEVYGPATACFPQDDWPSLDSLERWRGHARPGARDLVEDEVDVFDAETMVPVPRDGETIGEVMFRGNIAMKGYLKNPAATEEAFEGGWFHSGDLAVMHPDGYIQVKDRAKDIIISGGENISSIEVEDVLHRHPAVFATAVVALPDEKWGETPCAFVECRPGAEVTEEELIAFCRANMAHFKAPRAVVFGPLPKTSTGKIQKYVLRERVNSKSAIA